MRPYKAVQDVTQHATWHALVYKNGHWSEVRDRDGNAVAFTTSKEAIAEAKRAVDTP